MSLKLGIWLLPMLLVVSCAKQTPVVGEISGRMQGLGFADLECNLNTMNGIVGGECVNPGDDIQRRTAAVFFQTSSSYSICTASIVDERVILTAAHCVPDDLKSAIVFFHENARQTIIKLMFSLGLRKFDQDDFMKTLELLKAGKFDQNQFSMVRVLSKAIVHPSYSALSSKVAHDLALMRLNAPIPQTHSLTPLLSVNDSYAVERSEKSYVAAGYGAQNFSDSQSGYLRQADVARTFVREALNVLGQRVKVNFSLVSNEVVIDQRGAKGVCSGDSGGGLFVKSNGKIYIAGVASSVAPAVEEDGVYGLDPCYGYGLFMSTSYYLPWLEKNIKEIKLEN